MYFAYEGFTQDHYKRSFTFKHVGSSVPASVFCIELDLPLFLDNHVPVQEAPMFCLQLLRAASLAGPGSLETFRNYRVIEADLRPFLMERERRAAEKAMKKPSRRPFGVPSRRSNIYLGKVPSEH
jgi:hypothetical protein